MNYRRGSSESLYTFIFLTSLPFDKIRDFGTTNELVFSLAINKW